MNHTIEDNASVLSYSEDSWRQQPPNDILAAQSSGENYHVTQQDGANMTLTFQGTALYIFGSKGPGHASFSVRWLGFVQEGSAWDSSFQARQLLWSRVFPLAESDDDNTHTVALIANANGTNNWLDIDFITITTPARAQPRLGSYSTTNPAVLSALETAAPPTNAHPSSTHSSQSSATSRSDTASPSHASRTNVGALAAAVALGVCLLLLILGLLLYRHLKKRAIEKENRERNFRKGRSAPTYSMTQHTLSQSHLSINGSTHMSTTQRSMGMSASHTDLATEQDILRQEHNHSAMGWSTRTAVDVTRPQSMSGSISKPAFLSRVPSPPHDASSVRPISGAPPSYKPPDFALGGEFRYEAGEGDAQPSGESRHPRKQAAEASHPPSSFQMPSAAARENIFRMTPPTWIPQLGKRETEESTVVYDDGDSRRTNFLQV